MSSYRRSMRRVAITAGVLGLFGAVAAVPAAADTHPPLAIGLGCIPQGDSVIECIVNISGGVPPYTIHWNLSRSNSDDVTAGCEAGHPGTAVVTVTDSQLTQITQSRGYNCVGGPPR